MQVNDEDFQRVKGAEHLGEISNASRTCHRTESIEGGRNLTSSRANKVTSPRREMVNAGLMVLYLNARSIRNNLNELVAHIEIGRYDVVGITGTR